MKKRVVLIPYWVQETLKRNHLPLATCLDLAKLKPLLALNDLVVFSQLQNHMQTVLGPNVGILDELFWVWLNSTLATDTATKQFLTETLATLRQDPSFHKEVESRLFSADAKQEQYKVPFITYDLTPEVCGVVIYPGYFSEKENNDELQKSLVDAILKVFYVYDSLHEVAKTPLFKRYLELLSGK